MNIETTIQTEIAASIRALSEFAAGSVVVNDWRLLDLSAKLSPFVIVITSDVIRQLQNSVCGMIELVVPVILYMRFEKWHVTYSQFRDTRYAMVEQIFNTELTNGIIKSVANGGNIIPYTNPYTPVDSIHEETPLYLLQRINVAIEHYK